METQVWLMPKFLCGLSSQSAAWDPVSAVSENELGGQRSQSPILAMLRAPWEAQAGSSPPLGNSCQRPDSCIPLAGHSCH